MQLSELVRSGLNQYCECIISTGAAEMLAMEMKASGMYVSRGLSFKQAEFDTVEMTLTPDQVKMYDMATNLW